MRKLILLFTLIFSGFVFGQVKDTIIDGEKTVIYSSIEKEAVFSKGNTEFQRLIAENFRLKKIRANSLITCEIKFIVERDGTLSNITATGENESFNKEAIRAVTKIKEKWIPATINGQAVRERFKIPLTINFE